MLPDSFTDMESDIRDTARLLRAAMQLFGDHMSERADLRGQVAEFIFTIVTCADERHERTVANWHAAHEALVKRAKAAA